MQMIIEPKIVKLYRCEKEIVYMHRRVASSNEYEKTKYSRKIVQWNLSKTDTHKADTLYKADKNFAPIL